MADYTLSAQITGDSSGFEKAFSRAQTAINSFQTKTEAFAKKMDKIGSTLSSFGTKMTIGITTPLLLVGKKMTTAASDFDENLNKVEVAFAECKQEVIDWANTATEKFGLSKNQALEATSLFGDMATSMGLSKKEAAGMSTNLAGLAGDLASFKNISIDEAMTALNGVFTGETESLKRLGVVMTEANLQTYALSQGIKKEVKDMTQAEKVQLRYAYVLEMTKNAKDDYSRTSDGTANSIRTLQSSVDNLSIAFGQHLLPTITPLIQKATELINSFAEMSPEMQKMIIKIGAIAAAIGPAIIIIGKLASGFGAVVGLTGKIGGLVDKIGGLKGMFAALTSPVSLVVIGITALIASFGYLMSTNEEFKSSIMNTFSQVGQAIIPVLQQLGTMFMTIGTQILQLITGILQQLAPVIMNIISLIGEVIAKAAPLITQIISAFIPAITAIIQVVSEVINAIMPSLISIIGAVINAFDAIMPVVYRVLEVITAVISDIITVITPVIAFIGTVIAEIMGIIMPIAAFIADVINKCIHVISPILNTVITVFQSIYSTIAGVMGRVWTKIQDVFAKIKSSWDGLKEFVGGIFDGVASAVSSLVNRVKGFVNGVISGVNNAISIINGIPGVNISAIPYLLHGTDNWQGGFAYMNEGGRGELVKLPNGSQVIPHDISVKYAKEAARTTSSAEPLNADGILDGVIIQVINSTSVDGTPLKETVSDYTIRKINNQQRAVSRARGAYA